VEVYSFLTLATPSKGLYKEKGSRFLSFAYPVRDESEAKGVLESLKKEYYDASHHCFAFVLYPDKGKTKCYDDGEPAHSAGDPILGQILARDLTHVLVVVVRYFGGTKLGVGGLMQAYKTAAAAALTNAQVMKKDVTNALQLFCPYDNTPMIMKLVKEFQLDVLGQDFAKGCKLEAAVKLRFKNDFMKKVKLLNAKGARIEVTEIHLS
jgi:uncharacterized YigZ family protein